MTEQEFDEVVAVSFKGYFATIHYAAPHLRKTAGVIVNMSSPSGFGHYGMSNYASAKEAAVGLVRCAARDLAEHRVRAYAVRPLSFPSLIGTPGVMASLEYTEEVLGVPRVSHRHLHSAGIRPEPGPVAAVCAWLCTPEAEPLNGREIFIAGGHIALIQEPELIRSQIDPEGWTFEALCAEPVTRALTWGSANPLANARRPAQSAE
jgi:NAD(P)-dependent dehydrogenase (short-subunit alcohol dehydrogenase family)